MSDVKPEEQLRPLAGETVETGDGPRRPRPGPTNRARRASAAAGTVAPQPHPRPQPGPPRPASPARGATGPVPAPIAVRRRADRATAPLWLALVLGALALLAVAGLVAAFLVPSRQGSVTTRDQALAAAKTEVAQILSYDYKNFDAGLTQAKSVLTGRAVGDYTTAMIKTVKATALKNKATVVASTDSAGVESVSPDGEQVTVVVFGEQKVTNSSLSAPRTDVFRVRATLDLTHGRWLIAKFDNL